MICSLPAGSIERRLRSAAEAQDYPYSAMLELTRRCCFRCRHCYAGPGIGADRELPTATWLKRIDDCAEAGVLRLAMTGGEPLLREDFPVLYRHARRQGLLVALFTNAVLCAEPSRLECLKQYPPTVAEVTLYGATPEVAAQVTGVPDALERQWRGIDQLRAAGIKVTLKATAMRANRDEIPALRALASRLGLSFRLTTELCMAIDGSHHPATQQLSAPEAVALEKSDPSYYAALRLHRQGRAVSDRRYPCRAGLTSFALTADGYLQACIALRHHRRPLNDGSDLLTTWREVRNAVRRELLPLAWHHEIGHTTSWLQGVICPAPFFDDVGELTAEVDGLKKIACERAREMLYW